MLRITLNTWCYQMWLAIIGDRDYWSYPSGRSVRFYTDGCVVDSGTGLMGPCNLSDLHGSVLLYNTTKIVYITIINVQMLAYCYIVWSTIAIDYRTKKFKVAFLFCGEILNFFPSGNRSIVRGKCFSETLSAIPKIVNGMWTLQGTDWLVSNPLFLVILMF